MAFTLGAELWGSQSVYIVQMLLKNRRNPAGEKTSLENGLDWLSSLDHN